MSGFKNFLLRGNLVEIAVAFIIAGGVRDRRHDASSQWLTGLMPESATDVFGTSENRASARSSTRSSRSSCSPRSSTSWWWCPTPRPRRSSSPREASGPTELDLLTEIRDSLANKPDPA